ncbi:MAG: glycosyltransferase [Gemmatimonadetes bacterium]|nr:glycosyltransferase [Gemmatimonadota bacterium]
MRRRDVSPVQFHLISFEGPDAYSRAGGIASRVTSLAEGLARVGFETHLWFIGDPDLPGHETSELLHLHRWCQWISRHHPGGVYDGEEVKRRDLAASLPPVLVRELLRPAVERDGRLAVVLAEEWQTVDCVQHLDGLLRVAGLRDRVARFWNANNTFGFDRIDWHALARAATITTVSRYMRHQMWSVGVDPLVIPNGLSPDAFEPPDRRAVEALRWRLRGRLVLTKVARFDPDKRWLLAVDTVAELKRRGWRPLLIARGGIEPHGAEVLARAGSVCGWPAVRPRFPSSVVSSRLSAGSERSMSSISAHRSPPRCAAFSSTARPPCSRTAVESRSASSVSRRWRLAAWLASAERARSTRFPAGTRWSSRHRSLGSSWASFARCWRGRARNGPCAVARSPPPGVTSGRRSSSGTCCPASLSRRRTRSGSAWTRPVGRTASSGLEPGRRPHPGD